MGQFSWFTQDDHTQIVDGKKAVVYMVDPRDGVTYKEMCYKGYGVFGGRDYYELLADMNTKIALRDYDFKRKEYEELLSKKFEDLTADDIGKKRSVGIHLWFSYVEPDRFAKYAMKLKCGEKVICPILVRDPKKWKKLKGSHPDSDPDQGWA